MATTSRPRNNQASLRGALEVYRTQLQRLQEDLQTAIHDVLYRQNTGRIIHAVDFTEIAAYVIPREIGILPAGSDDHDRAERVALSLATLTNIFFQEGGPAPPVVLLPPHRFELRRSEYFFQQEALANFIQLVKKAEQELRTVLRDQRLIQILDSLDVADNKHDREAAIEAQQELLLFLNENASNLLLTATYETRSSATARLRSLLEQARLVDVSSKEIVGREVDPEELSNHVVSELHTIISRLRRSGERRRRKVKKRHANLSVSDMEARSHRDAMAVAYILRINDLLSSEPDLKPKNIRVLLITRSETLLAAVKEYGKRYDFHRLEQFVRRPTTTIAALLEPSGNLEDQLHSLRTRQATLSMALDGPNLKDSPTNKLTTRNARSGQLRQRLDKLRVLWRDAVNLTVAAGNWKNAIDPRRSDLTKLIAVLRDDDQLGALIAEAATKLAANINLNNALLALRGDATETISDTRIERTPPRLGGPRPAFIWAKEARSTIGLYFYHPIVLNAARSPKGGMNALRQLLQVHRSGKLGKSRKVLDSELSEDALLRDPTLIEACLASSFIQANSENWGLAETFASLATRWDEKLDATPKHEAYYLLAVSRARAFNPNEERIKAGLRDLDIADELIREQLGIVRDPRFLLERGKHHFALWEHLEVGPKMDHGPNKDELISEQYRLAMSCFQKAKDVLEESRLASRQTPDRIRRQMVDVANARCYGHILGKGPDREAVHLLVQLQKSLADCGWNYQNMPIPILDTICWTLFNLRETAPDQESLAAAVNALDRRSAEYKRPAVSRKLLHERLSAEKHYVAKRNARAL